MTLEEKYIELLETSISNRQKEIDSYNADDYVKRGMTVSSQGGLVHALNLFKVLTREERQNAE